MPVNTAKHGGEGDQKRCPPRQTAALEPAHERIEAERQEESRPHVQQNRRQRLHAGDEQDADPDAESGDESRSERMLQLHGDVRIRTERRFSRQHGHAVPPQGEGAPGRRTAGCR
jgi:hypothetical protein